MAVAEANGSARGPLCATSLGQTPALVKRVPGSCLVEMSLKKVRGGGTVRPTRSGKRRINRASGPPARAAPSPTPTRTHTWGEGVCVRRQPCTVNEPGMRAAGCLSVPSRTLPELMTPHSDRINAPAAFLCGRVSARSAEIARTVRTRGAGGGGADMPRGKPTKEARLRGVATSQAQADAFARSMAGTIAELEREGIMTSTRWPKL